MSDRLEVMVRAADVGDTFMSWTWLTPPHVPRTARLSSARLVPALQPLTDSLPGGTHQVGWAIQVAQRLKLSIFSAGRHSAALATLTSAVLPPELATEIAEKSATEVIRLRLCPSPRLAQIPWELLLLPDGRRLIEAAEIVHDPPTVFYAERRRQPVAWDSVAEQPVVYVVDPALQDPRHQVLTSEGVRRFSRRISEIRAAGRLFAGDLLPQNPRATVTRDYFSDALKTSISRLLFVGHISSDPEEPGSAAIHLSDVLPCKGMHRAAKGSVPLSALDFRLGTTLIDDPSVWDYYLSDHPQLGDEIWPMPVRVALVACEGSVDYRTIETYGLVMAILNAGAELVTTTRWALPSDLAFRSDDKGANALPTTELALEVDRAHDQPDPVAVLREWQVAQLHQWLADPDDLRYSPITWAAVTHTMAPRRD